MPNIDDLSIALIAAVARRKNMAAIAPPLDGEERTSPPSTGNGRLCFGQASGGVIGRDLSLPWHLPADLARFRRLTLDKTIIMGRRTHESIGRALDRRINIVVSGRPGFEATGCITVSSFEKALEEAALHPFDHTGEATSDGLQTEVLIIGGESIYRQALPLARRIYLTLVDTDIPGDTYFPEFDAGAWRKNDLEVHKADSRNPHDSYFFDLHLNDRAADRRGPSPYSFGDVSAPPGH